MRTFLLLLALILTAIVLRQCCFTVDASEYAYVTLLGKHQATYDGSNDDEAGLHFSWPWPLLSVQRLDRRLQYFDLPATEVLTRDPEQKAVDRTLSVEAYVLWKIADPQRVDQFVRRIGTNDQARAILSTRINSLLGAEVGKLRMKDLVNDKPGAVDKTMQTLERDLLQELQTSVETEFGIRIDDLRVKRLSHPSEVRRSIFERIQSERAKKAAEYKSEGERDASIKQAETDQTVSGMLEEARLKAARVKSHAETEALKLRNDAQSLDPQFYSFLKQMEKLQSILSDNKTVLLLSTRHPMFDLLFNPPGAGKKEAKTDSSKESSK